MQKKGTFDRKKRIQKGKRYEILHTLRTRGSARRGVLHTLWSEAGSTDSDPGTISADDSTSGTANPTTVSDDPTSGTANPATPADDPTTSADDPAPSTADPTTPADDPTSGGYFGDESATVSDDPATVSADDSPTPDDPTSCGSSNRSTQDKSQSAQVHSAVPRDLWHLQHRGHVQYQYRHQHDCQPIRRQENHALLLGSVCPFRTDAGHLPSHLEASAFRTNRQRADTQRHRFPVRGKDLLAVGCFGFLHFGRPIYLYPQAVAVHEPALRRLQCSWIKNVNDPIKSKSLPQSGEGFFASFRKTTGLDKRTRR